MRIDLGRTSMIQSWLLGGRLQVDCLGGLQSTSNACPLFIRVGELAPGANAR